MSEKTPRINSGARFGLWLCLVAGLLFVTIVAASGVGAAHPVTDSADAGGASVGNFGEPSANSVDEMRFGSPPLLTQVEEPQEEEEGGEAEEESNGEEGASVLGEWWGLGGEAGEAPYIGLVELGIVVLTVGLGGYMLSKRTSVVPTRYRRYLLPAHEWSMLLGTALTVPHFFAVEEWEGLGFVVGLLLAIEVASGLYGRHLHRHVIRLGRGDESPSILGRVIHLSKDTLFTRWRWLHRSLTAVTTLVLVLHILTAIGE